MTSSSVKQEVSQELNQENPLELKQQTNVYYFFIISIVSLWSVLVYKPLFSAVAIWSMNDIYNHCFIVIPASLFLIYEKRHVIDWSAASASYIAVVPLFFQLLLYTLGTAADIQLFQHAAIFSMLPTLIWLFLGNRIAWQCVFPLLFMLFSIPVGEELIPFLQQITADMSVAMLEWTGIPLFRSGLFIEIPQGKFLVAEACSGVSFLIASIVLGNLYAYMNLVSMKRRIGFVMLSIGFPIVANAIRVYGIILTGYLTDMEHAVGADHLVYGWFFFAFVLVCLFMLGELIKKFERKALSKNTAKKNESENLDAAKPNKQAIMQKLRLTPNKKVFGVVLVLLGVSLFQNYRMVNIEFNTKIPTPPDLSDWKMSSSSNTSKWQPRFVDSALDGMYHLSSNSQKFDVFYAYYDGTGGELISSLNKLYEQERWTLTNRYRPQVGENSIVADRVSSSNGNQRIIYYWYIVDGEIISSFSGVKLKQLFQRLKGKQSQAAIVAVSFDIDIDDDSQEDKMMANTERLISEFQPISR